MGRHVPALLAMTEIIMVSLGSEAPLADTTMAANGFAVPADRRRQWRQLIDLATCKLEATGS